LRNPLISDVLYKSREIEKWGSGLKKIYKLCKENNVKLDFKILKTGFMVVFYRPGAGNAEKVGEKVGERLSANQDKIIEIIRDNPHMPARKISELIGISQRKVEENISKLKKKGLLKRTGSDKSGHWEVLKNI